MEFQPAQEIVAYGLKPVVPRVANQQFTKPGPLRGESGGAAQRFTVCRPLILPRVPGDQHQFF